VRAIAGCLLSGLLLWPSGARAGEALALHPDNPRYLVLDGRPTVLVGSGEHYGAVVNPDFDFERYLATLAADGLNLTRLFVGSYVERPGDFGIGKNTLAPAPGRALVPWARSDAPGYALGGNKLDLDRWNPDYFERLHAFVAAARDAGVIVEVTLFSSYYGGGWEQSPLHASNNVNDVGNVPREMANTLANGSLRQRQEALVRKIVSELKDYENLYFEIQNEPWADRPQPVDVLHPYIEPGEMKALGMFWQNRVELADPYSLSWQAWVAALIADQERTQGSRHLIAQNFANFRYPLEAVDPTISVVNFHYAWPEAATLNLALERPIAFDESGFAGRDDATYRRQAWEFLLSGGAILSHLDYSFAVGREDGTASYPAPGGGSPALRRQLGVLKQFLMGFDLPRLAPRPDLIVAAPGAYVRCLADVGNAYALYVAGDGHTTLSLELPPGRYRAEWVDVLTGETVQSQELVHRRGAASLASPPYRGDIAARVVAVPVPE
jgi:hypothetical protein